MRSRGDFARKRSTIPRFLFSSFTAEVDKSSKWTERANGREEGLQLLGQEVVASPVGKWTVEIILPWFYVSSLAVFNVIEGWRVADLSTLKRRKEMCRRENRTVSRTEERITPKFL